MNRPSDAELIDAVTEFLQARVQPQIDAQTAFELRVAVNALAIVKRALSLRVAQETEDRDAFAVLLSMQAPLEELRAEAAARIRDGRLDAEEAALRGVLWRSTLGQVAIDNPRYATYRACVDRTPAPGEPQQLGTAQSEGPQRDQRRD